MRFLWHGLGMGAKIWDPLWGSKILMRVGMESLSYSEQTPDSLLSLPVCKHETTVDTKNPA